MKDTEPYRKELMMPGIEENSEVRIRALEGVVFDEDKIWD